MTPLKAKNIDGYVRVCRVNGRDGASYISPDVQREEITALGRLQGRDDRRMARRRGRVRRRQHRDPS